MDIRIKNYLGTGLLVKDLITFHEKELKGIHILPKNDIHLIVSDKQGVEYTAPIDEFVPVMKPLTAMLDPVMENDIENTLLFHMFLHATGEIRAIPEGTEFSNLYGSNFVGISVQNHSYGFHYLFLYYVGIGFSLSNYGKPMHMGYPDKIFELAYKYHIDLFGWLDELKKQ